MLIKVGDYRQLIIENSKIVLGLLGSLGLLLLVFLPTVTRLPANLENNRSQELELKKVKDRLQNANNLLSLQQSLKASLNLADKALPSSEEVPSLMTQIQAIATESAVTLKALQFGGISKVEGSNYKKITLQAILEGNYANLSTFLESVEKTSRLIDILSLTFDARKTEANLSASLGLTAYFLESPGRPLAEGSALTFTTREGLETLNYLKTLRIYEPQITPVTTGKVIPLSE